MATTTTIVVGRIADELESPANAITDEHFNSSFDVWVSLAHPDLAYDSVLVRTDDNVTTFTLGSDYQVLYREGKIKVLSGGSMADATAYHISYQYPETSLASKINAVTSPKQAAGKFYHVKTASDAGVEVAVIVTEN